MNERIQPVALVTGSGRQRVGHVVVQRLVEAGYAVFIHYHRSQDSAQQTVNQLRQQGHTAEAIGADLTQERDVDAMFRFVMQELGRIDLLVTTSSLWNARKLEDVDAQHVLDHFKLNTLATFLSAQQAGLLMVEQPDGGSIVTIGDWAIGRPYPNHASYFISKGSIPTLTQALAVELGLRNPKVRVNCIHPGPVLLADDMSAEDQEAIIDSTLVRTTNCPEAVAEAVLAMAQNPFMTGAIVPVDGGRSIFAGEHRRDRPI